MRSERGSALFLILIAVALFAALSYAVTQSGRGGGTVAKEQDALDLARLVSDAAAEMTYTINRIKLVNGCKDDQISFDGHGGTAKQTNGTPVDYFNPNAPADDSCDVFSKNGGGMVPPPLIPLSLASPPTCPPCTHHQSWFAVGAFRVLGVGTDTGAAGAELAFVRWLNKNACIAINNKFGIINPGGNPPVDDIAGGAGWVTFPAVYTDNLPIGDQIIQLQGKHDFCIEHSPWYTYVHVLIAR